MIRRVFLVLCLSFTLASVGFAYAQTPSTGDVAVELSPENPGPNQSVTITLKSFSLNIETAQIAWSVDGKFAVSGVGYDHYAITTKNIGAATSVSVRITPVGSAPLVKSIVITPMSVDVLWQAYDSAVPALYKGKALPLTESKIRFVAIPQIKSASGALLSSDNFVYSWKENYNDNSDQSGYAKDSFASTMDYLNPSKHIGVDVSTRDNTVVASNEIDVSPTIPELVWYAASPLYGPLYENALGTAYTLTSSDTSVIAFPFFFSPQTPASPMLTYTWDLNGNSIDTPNIPNNLFLHRDSTSKGDATIDVSILNVTKLFQQLSSTLLIHLN